MGSYTLSAIVTKVTGQTTLDYLKPRLFEPLGIENPRMGHQPRRQFPRRLWPEAPHRRHRQVRPALPAKGKVERQAIDPGEMGRAGDEQAGAERPGIATPRSASTGRRATAFNSGAARITPFAATAPDGQFCVVIPDKDAVIAITADTGNIAR